MRRDDHGRPALYAGNEPRFRETRAVVSRHRRPDPAFACPEIVAEPGDDQRHMLQIRAEHLQLVERRREVAALEQRVAVDRLRLALPLLPCHQRRRQPVFRRAGDQRDRAYLFRQFADRPQHLELELRDAVAVVGKRKALDHHIGCAAIGRRVVRPLLGGNQRIGDLRLGAPMDAQLDPLAVDLAPIGPDPADACHLALAKREGDVGEIIVFGDLRPGLAALPARRAFFLETRRPDHDAAEASRAVDARDRRALLGGEGPRAGQPWSFDAAGTVDQRLVDRVAGERAGRSTDRAADRAEQAADRGARSLQENGCHAALGSISLGKSKDAGDAFSPLRHQRRQRHSHALIGVHEVVLPDEYSRHAWPADAAASERAADRPPPSRSPASPENAAAPPLEVFPRRRPPPNPARTGQAIPAQPIDGAPDAEHQPDTVAADTLAQTLVSVRRAQPGERLAHHRIRYRFTHGTTGPPSNRPPSTT